MKKGICCAGNIIVDVTYSVNAYPQEGELVHIESSSSRSMGGLAANCIVDLARLDPALPLTLAGNIGDDDLGRFSRSVFAQHPNIDVSGTRALGPTGYTLVIGNTTTKSRTFFTFTGGNGLFGEEHVDWDSLNADIIHAGYIFLLPNLDRPDPDYGTGMARFLHTAQEHGLKTSTDVVSQAGADFAHMVPPALKYVDYLTVNELEAQQITGIPLRDAGGLHRENFRPALEKLKSFGVSTWAVIHCPELGCGLDENGQYIELNSLNLPADYIKGTVGAGDAFCSGVLYAAEQGWNLDKAILLGNCTAAASLSEQGGTEGVRPVNDVLQLARLYGASDSCGVRGTSVDAPPAL